MKLCSCIQLYNSYFTLQIADFGMARDVSDDTYYITGGGKIPVKWTAPEVWIFYIVQANNELYSTIGNTLQKVFTSK